MRHTKTGYIPQNFWHGILVCLVFVCPFLASAEEHNTQSETQETTDRQNQNPPHLTQQDLHDITTPLIRDQKTLTAHTTTLIETQKTLTAHTTRYMVILGILLLAILSAFVWLFFQYRILVSELNDIKKSVGAFSNVNSSLKRDLSDIKNRIQKFTKTFDSEVLYQKLAAENESSRQNVLNLIKPIIDRFPNEGSTILSEGTESSEQHRNHIGEERPSHAVVEFCDYYNIGIKDKLEWKDFIDRYDQNYKIDVVNAEERYLNPQVSIAPIFKTDSAGCFLACYIEEKKVYAVVPVYNLVVERSIYIPGAFGEVFKCSHVDDHCNYQIMELIEPAIFEPDEAKETWTLQSKGILELKEV